MNESLTICATYIGLGSLRSESRVPLEKRTLASLKSLCAHNGLLELLDLVLQTTNADTDETLLLAFDGATSTHQAAAHLKHSDVVRMSCSYLHAL